MVIYPYVIVFFLGFLTGAYACNLKFRTKTNELIKKFMKKMAKADVGKGFK